MCCTENQLNGTGSYPNKLPQDKQNEENEACLSRHRNKWNGHLYSYLVVGWFSSPLSSGEKLSFSSQTLVYSNGYLSLLHFLSSKLVNVFDVPHLLFCPVANLLDVIGGPDTNQEKIRV